MRRALAAAVVLQVAAAFGRPAVHRRAPSTLVRSTGDPFAALQERVAAAAARDSWVRDNWRTGRCKTTAPLTSSAGAVSHAHALDDAMVAATDRGDLLVASLAAPISPPRRFSVHDGPIRCLHGDRRLVVSGGSDGYARVSQYYQGKLLPLAEIDTPGVSCVAVDADDRTVTTGSDDGRVRKWRLPDSARSSAPTMLLDVDVGCACSALASAPRYTAFEGPPRPAARRWRGGPGVVEDDDAGDDAADDAAPLSAGGPSVAVGTAAGELVVLRVGDGDGEAEEVARWRAHRGVVLRCLAYGGIEGGVGGTYLLSGADDGVIRAWKVSLALFSSSSSHPPVPPR